MLNNYYVHQLNTFLNDFLEEFDCTATLGTDFAYYYAKNLITYAIVVPSEKNDSFLTFVNKLFPDIQADVFLWSFLHELGHNETMDDFEDEEHQIYHHIINYEELEDEYYYNLPIEKAATEWAGNFMRENIQAVQKLWNNIQPLIVAINKEIDFN